MRHGVGQIKCTSPYPLLGQEGEGAPSPLSKGGHRGVQLDTDRLRPRRAIRANPRYPRHPRLVLPIAVAVLAIALGCTSADDIVRLKGKRYFGAEGKTFFPIGMNLCWPSAKGVAEYEDYFQKMQQNGMNFCRVWLGPFDCFTIETKDGFDETGLKNVDALLDLAAKYGIRVMLCIESFNSLRISQPYAMWETCPYNKKNGGPCAAPQEFFTNADARARFKRRLKTLIDRFAARKSVFAWELWNEVDISESFNAEAVRDWHKEMADYVKANDPYHHLVTTSFANPEGVAIIDQVDGIDFVQIHFYDAQDFAQRAADLIKQRRARVPKPVVIGEFGAGTEAEGNACDPTGVHLHNTIWSSVMAGAAGCANIWWWDSYVDPKDLYHHYASLAKFLRGIELSDAWVPLATNEFRYQSDAVPTPVTVDIQGNVHSWEKHPANQPATVTIDRDGTVHAPAQLTAVLHGLGGHKDKHNPITFVVDFARDGEFVVAVTGVSGWGGARLVVRVDGNEDLNKEFADPDGMSSTATLHQYDGDYRVRLSSGAHKIEVENVGPDWIYASYSFLNCAQTTRPPLRCWGLSDGKAALLWIQNEGSTWQALFRKETLRPVAPSRVLLPVAADARASITLWDPWKGEAIGPGQTKTEGDHTWLLLPAVERDIAVKVTPAGKAR
jgi:hypothetical protein